MEELIRAEVLGLGELVTDIFSVGESMVTEVLGVGELVITGVFSVGS